MNTGIIYNFLHKEFVVRKLYSPFGVCIFLLIALLISYLISKGHLLAGSAIISLAAGISIAIVCFLHQRLGLVICISASFFINILPSLLGDVGIPFGAVVEVLILITFLGIILKKTFNNDYSWKFAADPITYTLGFLLLFQLFLVVNPNNAGLLGYILIIKRQLILFCFFITCLYCFQHKKNVIFFIRFWIGLSFFVALYACKQQWIGFFQFEETWLYNSELAMTLYFIGGRFRVFSILGNPTIMAIMLSLSSIFIIVLLTGRFSIVKKITLGILLLFMLLAVGYSGTRTAFAMIPGGVLVFLLMNMNRRETIVLASGAILGFAVLLYGPFNNQTIQRVRSTFYPEHDASFNVRDINRNNIQPYIYANPIGGGLSTTSTNGLRYNPTHRLAGFPNDSEYLKTALETGYIGYFILLTSYFLILNTIINRFYSAVNTKIKLYYGAIAASVFALVLANYSQETAGMFPNDIVFYLLYAFAVSLYRLEPPSLKKISNEEI